MTDHDKDTPLTKVFHNEQSEQYEKAKVEGDDSDLNPLVRGLLDSPYRGYDQLMVRTAEALKKAFPDEASRKKTWSILDAHEKVANLLKPTVEWQNKIDAYMSPAVDVHENLFRKFMPALKVQEAINDSIRPYLELQRQATEAFKNLNLPELDPLTEYGDQYRKMIEVREEKYPNLSKNLEKIAKHSWFFCSNMSFRSYERLAFIIEKIGDEEEQGRVLDREFSTVYRESFDYLGEQILKNFPQRAFAISPAMDAHRENKYSLSVPIFLSQAEGIIREITTAEMFTKTRGQYKNIADYANDKRSSLGKKTTWIDIIDDAVWAQLSIELPIAVTGHKHKSGINRNLILHGIDLSYANELYSLKAYSLLCHADSLAGDI